MCHLCWTEPGKFGTISIITNVTSLSIYVKYQATLLRNDHLIQFAGIQRKNLKELNLIGRSNVTGYGFKQSFQVQETLESLSVIENHALEFCYLQHLPKLKRLEVNGCPYFLRESLDNKQAMSIVFFTDLTHVCCDVDYTKHLVQSSKNLLVVDWSSSNQGYSHADHNFAAKELIVRSHQICQDRPNLQMNCLKIIMDDRDWGKILLYTLTHLEKSANIPLHLPSSMKMYLELGIEILADSVEDKQSKTRMYFQQLLNSMYTVRDQNRKDSYDNNSTPIAYKYFKPSWLNDHNVQYGQQQLVELLKRMLSSN
ncbi:hypothetical protein C9374_001037 [Naegleria lovaniensis]|uniref:Uncharacterized protein n=1 Tax=Naegleria lovaniensis TaxID=51637 RepID=A0AA88GW91_NAELO|nr:uncharacterized protein C9374_001037 [Naegleria lovaniensis]KAG2388187.1 hypothetical protein C9374_001037 [Naegleria lovaniensis]